MLKNEMRGAAMAVHRDELLGTVEQPVAVFAGSQFCGFTLRWHTL